MQRILTSSFLLSVEIPLLLDTHSGKQFVAGNFNNGQFSTEEDRIHTAKRGEHSFPDNMELISTGLNDRNCQSDASMKTRIRDVQ